MVDDPRMAAAIPRPLYACYNSDECECVTDPDELFWHAEEGVFYCQDHHDAARSGDDPYWADCPTLLDALKISVAA